MTELKVPTNRNKIKHCFKLMKDAMHNLKNEILDTKKNWTCHNVLCSFNIVEQIFKLKEKKISRYSFLIAYC